jgi:ubiquinone/menaquinone biosynthesis C-methylase UbiE
MLAELERRMRYRGVSNIQTVLTGLGEGKLPADEFDVAFLVTVLGEVSDKPAVLAEIHRSLREGGILSITEVLPDPHYQPLRRVRALAHAAGFREQQVFTGALAYTMNLVKDHTA